jgi:hypothetical protein
MSRGHWTKKDVLHPGKVEEMRPCKPLPAGKPLAPYLAPRVPAGKFTDIPGQAAMDFSRDEWDALEGDDEGDA